MNRVFFNGKYMNPILICELNNGKPPPYAVAATIDGRKYSARHDSNIALAITALVGNITTDGHKLSGRLVFKSPPDESGLRYSIAYDVNPKNVYG